MSHSDFTPLTAIPPTTWPSKSAGSPPPIGITPANERVPMRPAATMSSKKLVGRRVTAEQRAFSIAICAEDLEAPGKRRKASKCPPSSTTAMETAQPLRSASSSAAASMPSTSLNSSSGFIRMSAVLKCRWQAVFTQHYFTHCFLCCAHRFILCTKSITAILRSQAKKQPCRHLG
ncbi:hypothetical protein D3C86_1312520 [compost metagenome]